MNAVIFDIDDTLYERSMPFRLAYEKLFASRWPLDCEQVYRAFFRHGNEVFEDSMNRKITMEEMYIYRIRHAMEDFQIRITDEEALAFQDAYCWGQNHIRLSSGMEEVLNFCHSRNLFSGIITNGCTGHQHDKYLALGLSRWIPEDAFLASEDAGINKPDPRIFHFAAQKWNLTPSDTWYIGDSYQHDIRGAHDAGWNTIWLNKTGRSVSSGNRASGTAGHGNHSDTSEHKLQETAASDGNSGSPERNLADYTVRSGEELLFCLKNLFPDCTGDS